MTLDLPFSIEPAELIHIQGIYDVLRTVAVERKFLDTTTGWPLDVTAQFIAACVVARAPCLVGLADQKVVAFGYVSQVNEPCSAHVGVLGMAVLADYRGYGIGQALLEATLRHAWRVGLSRVELCARSNNAAAIALYRKLGFVEEGRKRDYVRIDGEKEDHVLMALMRDSMK